MNELSLVVGDNTYNVLCLGAHCDDIEIGCGATILRLASAYPAMRFHWVTFSANEVREVETRNSAALFLSQSDGFELEFPGFRNGYFPSQGAEIKDWFEALKLRYKPDLIFTHFGGDFHQDHRVISELTWNTFRNQLILEYEIPKFDGDLGSPSLFVPADDECVSSKVDTLVSTYVSQVNRQWFTRSTFEALMRIRGIECNSPSGFAEAFYVRKIVLG